MHSLLLAHQDHLKAKQLRAYAEQVELDMERYDFDMKEETYLQRIREHAEGARRSGARGTPTFFVNGRLTDVSFGLQHLAEAVERLVKK
jgi:protein-disulfide isomerase